MMNSEGFEIEAREVILGVGRQGEKAENFGFKMDFIFEIENIYSGIGGEMGS